VLSETLPTFQVSIVGQLTQLAVDLYSSMNFEGFASLMTSKKLSMHVNMEPYFQLYSGEFKSYHLHTHKLLFFSTSLNRFHFFDLTEELLLFSNLVQAFAGFWPCVYLIRQLLDCGRRKGYLSRINLLQGLHPTLVEAEFSYSQGFLSFPRYLKT
jgi:hypothetical protein